MSVTATPYISNDDGRYKRSKWLVLTHRLCPHLQLELPPSVFSLRADLWPRAPPMRFAEIGGGIDDAPEFRRFYSLTDAERENGNMQIMVTFFVLINGIKYFKFYIRGNYDFSSIFFSISIDANRFKTCPSTSYVSFLVCNVTM